MQVTDCTAKNAASTEADAAAVIQALQAEVASLKEQLDWFKRQLFGRKSEKRIIEHPDQLDLSALLGDTPPPTEPEPTEEITYRRRKRKQRNADDVTDTGLRFGPDVPIEVIELSAPQLEGPEADQYEVIDHKISRRLAQRPGSYVVLEYRPGATAQAQPPADGGPSPFGDVRRQPTSGWPASWWTSSLITCRRRHQRLKDAGITLSRSTLTNYTQRAIELLGPIVDAQWQHILQSQVLAMDETPIKASQMQSAWYWPIYGEDDELCFTWSSSRGSVSVQTTPFFPSSHSRHNLPLHSLTGAGYEQATQQERVATTDRRAGDQRPDPEGLLRTSRYIGSNLRVLEAQAP